MTGQKKTRRSGLFLTRQELLLGNFCFGSGSFSNWLVSHFGFLGSSFLSAGSLGSSSFLRLHFLGFSSFFHFGFLGISSFVGLGVGNGLNGWSGSRCSGNWSSSRCSNSSSNWLGSSRCSRSLSESSSREQTGDQGGENFVHFENPR